MKVEDLFIENPSPIKGLCHIYKLVDENLSENTQLFMEWSNTCILGKLLNSGDWYTQNKKYELLEKCFGINTSKFKYNPELPCCFSPEAYVCYTHYEWKVIRLFTDDANVESVYDWKRRAEYLLNLDYEWSDYDEYY